MSHSCDCNATDRDDVVEFILDTLEAARDEALAGRPTEAQTINLIAQTAIAVAQITPSGEVALPTLTGGPH